MRAAQVQFCGADGEIRDRLTAAARRVETPRELALLCGPTRTERDAASRRFEYSLEATWKAGQ
jgi:hypothetical protein